MSSLLNLPLDVFHYVLDYLPLSSIYRLGAVCRQLHRLIHQNDDFWKRKVRLELGLRLSAPELEFDYGTDEADFPKFDSKQYVGLVHDSTLQANKEFYLIYSKEFQTDLRLSRQRINGQSEIEKLLRLFMPKMLNSTKNFLFCDPNFSARCALFGPGIESSRTKHLVHRVVNARDDLFEAVEFVSGLPGGFGSGVRIDFKKIQTFELICLYTNSEKIRESQHANYRLTASHNRLLVSDVSPEAELPSEVLHENVRKLLPTLDALLFAVDVAPDAQQTREEQLFLWKRELEIMLHGMERHSCRRFTAPILVLCCSNSAAGSMTSSPIVTDKINKECDDLTELSSRLGLESVSHPWGLFNVDIANMSGLEKGLDWVLYHIQKRRIELEYHCNQAKNF